MVIFGILFYFAIFVGLCQKQNQQFDIDGRRTQSKHYLTDAISPCYTGIGF